MYVCAGGCGAGREGGMRGSVIACYRLYAWGLKQTCRGVRVLAPRRSVCAARTPVCGCAVLCCAVLFRNAKRGRARGRAFLACGIVCVGGAVVGVVAHSSATLLSRSASSSLETWEAVGLLCVSSSSRMCSANAHDGAVINKEEWVESLALQEAGLDELALERGWTGDAIRFA